MTRLSDFALRSRFPQPVKEAVKIGVESFGQATSGMRSLPEFIIIGGQRCGTTSLYQYLIEVPSIAAASTKEVHYFDVNYGKGFDWYVGHFPARGHLRLLTKRTGARGITGEASPYYLFHPLAPYRIADALPDVKLILMLRDPVSRLISQFHHETSLGWETLTLQDAIAAESARIGGEESLILADPRYNSAAHQHHSYFARGLYAEQLERWFEAFPREQFHIIEAGAFFKRPSDELDRVLEFIGQQPIRRSEFETHNAQRYAPVDPGIKQELRDAYAEPNERLWALLGDDLGWNDPDRRKS